MAIKILSEDEKQVQIVVSCKKKNAENLKNILNTIVNNYEGEPIAEYGVRHDFVFHGENLDQQKRNKNYVSLVDCMYTQDFSRHF